MMCMYRINGFVEAFRSRERRGPLSAPCLDACHCFREGTRRASSSGHWRVPFAPQIPRHGCNSFKLHKKGSFNRELCYIGDFSSLIISHANASQIPTPVSMLVRSSNSKYMGVKRGEIRQPFVVLPLSNDQIFVW